MASNWENCDPALKAWVTQTCKQLEAALGENHVGTYLHGSLASGSFYLPKSDVDLLFVVARSVDARTRRDFSVLAALANGKRPIVGSLECSVVRRSALEEQLHPLPCEMHFGEEWADDILADRFDFASDRTDPDLAAHVQATCEFGIPLAGPNVAEVFAPLSRANFVDSIRGDLAWILQDEHILESPFYGVLNVGRVLWVLEGASARLVPSKDEAGEWLLRAAPVEHREAIQLALDVYHDSRVVPEAERRTAGRQWPRESLLSFRDWARKRAETLETGAS